MATFTVEPASAATTCTVAAAGDIAESGGGQAKTAAIVKTLNPTAVLTLGDNAYPRGSSADYVNYYEPTWGKFKAITKPAPGNHEYYTPGGTGYLNYFKVKPYYAYDLCGWRMYSLNRELGGAERAAELAWYRADLAANAGKPMLAVWHEPRWTSGSKHGSDSGAQDLWAASVAGGVKVVLSGHEHSYERLGPMDASGKAMASGTREFVVGEGGNDGLSSFGPPLPTSEKRVSGQQGVLSMTFRPTGYDFALHQVGGSVADRGTVSFAGQTEPTPPTPSRPTPPPPPPTGSSQSSPFTAIEDASVSEVSTASTASTPSLPVGGRAGERSRTYLKFAVTGVPSGATDVRASLELTAASTGTFKTEVHRADSTWTESGLTWANQPGKAGTKLAGIAALTEGASRSFNVSSAISGNGLYSFVLSAGNVTAVNRFASSESSTPPVLTLTWKGHAAVAAAVSNAPTVVGTSSDSDPGAQTSGPASGRQTGRAWAAPALSDPVTIHLSNDLHDLKLDRKKDYRLVMPRAVLDVGNGALTINGGHNVVLVGGQLTSRGAQGSVRATHQTGTLHIEGLYVSGQNLQEGMQFQDEGTAVVQLVNVRIDTVHGSTRGHHADVLQTWGGGPKTLRIDGLTASTEYQALMLADASSVVGWDFRHVNISHVGSAGWTVYDSGPTAQSIAMSSVYLAGNDDNGVYSLGHGGLKQGLRWGSPPAGDFVPADAVGLAYLGNR